MRVRLVPLLALMGCTSLLAGPVWAQDEEAEAEGEEAGDAEEGDAAGEEAKATPSEAPPVAAADADSSPVEAPGQTYRFVGLRYRFILVPKFVMNFFGDGGRSVWVDNVGPEFAIRKDNFEYIFSLTWADYGMEETPFKSSSDPDQGWEHVESQLWMIKVMADFLWSSDVSPEFSINYGLGAGLGLVFGDLLRSQVRPRDGRTAGDPADYVKCARSEAGVNPYCEPGDPFEREPEPSWANDGSKPIIFPWLALQTGVRFKPHRRFVGRFDIGFAAPGLFFFGLGADYGL